MALIKSTLRLQMRHKKLSLINMLGIIMGYICFFLIISYIWQEKSYDRFHKNAENIYRLSYTRYDQGTVQYNTANTFYPCGAYLKQHSPDVVNSTTIARNYNITISFINAQGEPVFFNEEKSYFAPASFLSVFSYPVLKGNARDLDAPDKVFITQHIAAKYFGSNDPIGKVIKVNGNATYAVAGVLKDIPGNTHLKFDFLFSMPTHLKTLGNGIYNNWGYDLFYTYLQLRNGAKTAALEKMLPVMVAKNYGNELALAKERDVFKLQQLTSLHLQSNLEWETEKPGNGEAVTILIYFSAFVLLITWINLINLSSAQATERAKEVGIRKTLGASRQSVLVKFAGEIVLLNIFSLLIATVILFAAYFIAGGNTIFQTLVYQSAGFWSIIISAIVAGILVTSIMPAVLLSRFKPAAVLKGKLAHSFQTLFLRKALLGFQFVMSFILITGALIIYNQGNYLMHKSRGLNNTAVVAVKFPKTKMTEDMAINKAAVFNDEVSRMQWVKDYTMATDMPEREIETFGGLYRPELGSKDMKYYFRIGADENYFNFFKVKLVAGRFFSKEMPTDVSSSVILNESAVKKLGFNDPLEVINKIIIADDNKPRAVIGVVSDFHYRSVKVKPVATMFNYQKSGLAYFGIKLQAGDQKIKEHIASLDQIYSQIFPENPFDFYFLEDAMKTDLQADLDFARVFGLFSAMSILISLIGLLGLVIVNLNQRVKELGIRKVIGASFSQVCLLVLKTLTAPLGIALLIGIPLSVWGFSAWIARNYIYHIAIGWYYFMVPALFLPLMAALVIVAQVIKAYNQKIVSSLKYE